MKYKKKVTENVVLCGKFAIGFKNGIPMPETHLWREDAYWPTTLQPHQDELEGITVSLTTIWGHNYFHWLTECLTQLLCLDMDKVDHIFVPPWYPAFAHESLEYLDQGHKIVNWIGTPTRVTLASVGPQRIKGISYAYGLKKLLERFSVRSAGTRRLFVNRSDAKSRRILNRRSFLAEHAEYEEIDNLSQMTLMEQIGLFSTAKEIIGPHGAALANMLWSDKCRVVELFGLYTNPCYQKLAVSLGHEYSSVSCRPMGEDMFVESGF